MSLQRAEILLMQRRFELAEEEVRLALERDPNHAAALAMLSICLSKRGQTNEAMEVARATVAAAPTDYLAHLALSSCAYRAGHADEAVTAARESIQLHPNNPDAWSQLSWARILQNYPGEALIAARQGLALDPSHVELLNANAFALSLLGSSAMAMPFVAASLAQCPEAAATHCNAGWIALWRSDARTAEHHFREALRIDPSLQQPLEGLYCVLAWKNPLLRYLYEQGFSQPWKFRRVRIALGFVLFVSAWLLVLAFVVPASGRPWCMAAALLMLGLALTPTVVHAILSRVIRRRLQRPQPVEHEYAKAR